MNRRSFLALGLAVPAFGADERSEILSRIKPPQFPDREFDIAKFGAVEGGKKDSTEAIAKAIAACSAAGGGRVYVSEGVYLTGAIHLKSGVNLHLMKDATLLFNRDPKLYLPVVFTRWEGTECMNYSPFIYAFEQTNIAISGAGTLDGNANCDFWWNWSGKGGCGKSGEPTQAQARKELVAAADKDVPVKDRVFGEGRWLRPQFVQPYRCTNVLIEGVTIRNSPMWEINPVLCRNVTVRDVKIFSHGPNNDGCDPESSTDVLIDNCEFDTGDDCIAIKSGRNRDGRRVAAPSQNIIVTNCAMKDGHGGVTIGSEASGDVRNVYVDNCNMDSPNLLVALRIKTNSYRGGKIENIFMRNCQVGQVAGAVLDVDLFYEEGEGGAFTPLVRNVVMENVRCGKSKYAVSLKGYQSAPVRDVSLSRCTFDHVEKENVIQNVAGLRVSDVAINGRKWVL
ncbi:MAG TPA: glycoside hydrolase family 28 protein [Bryobacteraceae bacterium]|jgi:polygalacturonase|nr:glycoside hydrolase family 28 protein [Bryobacteraceae bacterium]